MTKNDQLDQRFGDLTCDDAQQQQQQQSTPPFHIVLVDIKHAAREKEIVCVEKPLFSEQGLKYVALSYRWGELQEKIIDTGLGYSAGITSFDLNNFYDVCSAMMQEPDLQHMDYVWVDAICVDQTNYDRRKATIYQMSTIYERASYILAVPDLHAAYLRNTSTSNQEIMAASLKYSSDIYHLIHGNTDQLAHIEKRWLDYFKVPEDPALRQLLTSSTNYFFDGFKEYRPHHDYYNAEEILDHLYEKSQSATTDNNNDFDQTQAQMDGINRMHDCNEVDCPLDFVGDEVPEWREKILYKENRCRNLRWKQLLQERGTGIKQSMVFMGDLIVDWSSRVWVISEYSIARKKNNMKYWFIQLGTDIDCGDEDFTFFKFNFDDPAFSAAIHDALAPTRSFIRRVVDDPPYRKFHQTMLTQLNQQSLFEMLLKSKASRNEDRFYAILPLSKYKNKLVSKEVVSSWKINSMVSVKLKLYEIMNAKDKWLLLFKSGHSKSVGDGKKAVFPTFATTTLHFPNEPPMPQYINDDASVYNIDWTDTSAITFIPFTTTATEEEGPCLSKLNIKPKAYYLKGDNLPFQSAWRETVLCKRLQLNDPDLRLDVLCIPFHSDAAMKTKVPLDNDIDDDDDDDWSARQIHLIGSFEKNIWTLTTMPHSENVSVDPSWTHHDTYSTGFDIY